MLTIFSIIFVLLIFSWYVYDHYVQRQHTLLVNYPIIGRARYLLETFREPFRQYFGNEDIFESRDKIEWVYKAARNKNNFISFSPSQPQKNPKFMIKHAFSPLNNHEVSNRFCVTFGEHSPYPFTSNSIISRSAMSDGAISPEGTQAFSIAALRGKFPINTGEGGLTSNFLVTHRSYDPSYMDIINLKLWQKKLFRLIRFLFNTSFAISTLKSIVLDYSSRDTYMFDRTKMCFYRINWDASLDSFPKSKPDDIADIIFQIGSGLYGVRDKKGFFDIQRYKKVMRFCVMTEIKLAQGAKQTGGKLTKNKVTDAIAYFRGVTPYRDLFSPNRFPYANTIQELFDFIEELKTASQKPVGFKIVISNKKDFEDIAKELKIRINSKQIIPDFITIDGGEGGSATAPLELMERVGYGIKDALFIADEILREHDIRDHIKLVVSGKVLTPDHVIILLALGADMVSIGRGFMMSAGCIRAKVCSGAGKHQCPVGLATQDVKKRKAYIVHKNAKMIENYHQNLLQSIRTLLAIMGLHSTRDLKQEHLFFIDARENIFDDVREYFLQKFNNKLKIY